MVALKNILGHNIYWQISVACSYGSTLIWYTFLPFGGNVWPILVIKFVLISGGKLFAKTKSFGFQNDTGCRFSFVVWAYHAL